MRDLRGEKPLPDAGPKVAKFSGKSRVAIIGDSDFATNSFFHIMGNGKLFLNSVNYLASQENLIGIEPRTYDLPRVNLTNRQMKGQKSPPRPGRRRCTWSPGPARREVRRRRQPTGSDARRISSSSVDRGYARQDRRGSGWSRSAPPDEVRVSRNLRSTSYSSAKPKPPSESECRRWRPQGSPAASILAIFASARSVRRIRRAERLL